MRKKILEALNTKFPGVSDSKLNRIVDNLVKKVKSEDEIEAAVEEITVESLLDSYGDARANLSRDSIIKDYEKKNNLKDGKPVGKEDNGGEQEDETKNGSVQVAGAKAGGKTDEEGMSPEMKMILGELKALKKQNDTLTSAIATMQTEKVTSTREQQFRELIKNLPEDSKKRYMRDYAFMNFDTDDKFNSYLEAIRPDVEEEETATKQAEAHVGGTKGGGSAAAAKGKVDPIVQERIDDKKAETTSPAIVGLSAN